MLKKLLLIMVLLFTMFTIAAPAMAFGVGGIDGLAQKVEKTDIVAWMQLFVIAWGAVSMLRKQWRDEVTIGKMGRLSFIKDHIPEIHGLAQKAARMFKNTDKPTKFVSFMDSILRTAGFLPIQPHEVDTIKMLGSGYHQEYKDMRDVPLKLPESLKPLEDSEAE